MAPEAQDKFDGHGFNSHQSLTGSFYLWPFLCDALQASLHAPLPSRDLTHALVTSITLA